MLHGIYTHKISLLQTGPLIDRVKYAGIDSSTEETIIQTSCNKLKGLAKTTDGSLTVKHLRELKQMALFGGVEYKRENKLMPMRIKTTKGFC